MTDVIFETARALGLLVIVACLLDNRRKDTGVVKKGWPLILCGFMLLFFASLLDISDNYPQLSRFAVIGDTPIQSFLENAVGYFGGFLLLAIGLLRWSPKLERLAGEDLNHRRVEAEALESAQLLKQAARMAQLGHWVWDEVESRYIFCSEELASLYGYTSAEFIERYGSSQNISRDIHPDDREAYAQNAAALDAAQGTYEIEYRERVRSGEYRYFREFGQQLYDEAGQVVRTVGFSQDVSQYKETEEALNQAKRQAEEENQAKLQFLSETAEVMSAMAQGDLGKRIEGDYTGNFASLKGDTNRMGEQIRAIAGRIKAASAAVQDATRRIAANVTDLSSRTESSVEETTASMDELSKTVHQNADNAQNASKLADDARVSAASGSTVVDEAVVAMSRIEESSNQITDIVGLIQDIAFQTNLLALNAAVEAARAGDAGKGFAVVAKEVRTLAERAGEASRDIQGLINNSDDQVRKGVDLVNNAGQSLGDIVTSVNKVADFVSEIAAASKGQSFGIDKVKGAINSMDEMTRQNGELVEQTSVALRSAESQVEDLRKIVTFFKIEEQGASPQGRGLAQELKLR